VSDIGMPFPISRACCEGSGVQLAAEAEVAASTADAKLMPGLERALRTRRVALKRRTAPALAPSGPPARS
jgi:hypothetical protein